MSALAAISAMRASRERVKRAQQQQVPGVEIELPRHRVGEVAVRLLDQQQVAELRRRRAGTRARPRPARAGEARLDLAGVGEPQPRLAQQIEPDVGEGDVLLQHRPVPDPFAQSLREDQVAVAEPQQVFESACAARRCVIVRCA